MNSSTEKIIKEICSSLGNQPSRLMDIVNAVQRECKGIDDAAIDSIAKALNVPRVKVEGIVTFYGFLSKDKKAKTTIRLCNDIVDQFKGLDQVVAAFENELGIRVGQITEDGAFSLEYTPCIGLCDQAPGALINGEPVTCLTEEKVKKIVAEMKSSSDTKKCFEKAGDGNNANPLINSCVNNNLIASGEVIFAERQADSGLKNAVALDPEAVIAQLKNSRLRGRGGAGFPTGMKWGFTRKAKGEKKYILCNADEGEPGTFKDRVLLTEKFDMVIEGMTIGAYAIGAKEGVIYVRGEYVYMLKFLEDVIAQRRKAGLLGKDVAGKAGFDFDVRIQLGAGAYICGEETALISSAEGSRGDPKTRPPFPAQKGYLEAPTSVNNVETFCCVARIMEKGAEWFTGIGSKGSPGTKLLSISGDCKTPGIYEFPFGTKVSELLKVAGASDAFAVLMGGPSGQFIPADQFDRTICYDDLATGGSVVVFNKTRDLLKIVEQYMEFFVEESCGYCTPCRVGNVLLKQRLDKVLKGKGEPSDIDYLIKLCETIKFSSRCGLGQTSPNPILSTIKNFKSVYEGVLLKENQIFEPDFDIKAALKDGEAIAFRDSVKF